MEKTLLYLILLVACNGAYALKINRTEDIIGRENEVTSIDLSNKGLTEFPAEILKCENLVDLNLSNNGIIQLPVELGELKHLKELDLSGNQGLSFSALDEVLSLAKFNLSALNLANCEMFFIPTKIGMQKQIKKLNLENNKLKSLPYHMIQLSKMEVLNLSRNNLEDISWQVNQWWGLKVLDVSNNPKLKTDELIVSLSFADGLDKLVMSDLTFLPNDFDHLNVNELEIRNAKIDRFPRDAESTPIRKLTFISCEFKNPNALVSTLNSVVNPEFLGLEKIKIKELIPFLAVDVDSIAIQNNGLSDLRPLVQKKNLVWLDARDNNLDRDFTMEFVNARPDISLFIEEPITPNKGISPPIEKFVQKPIIKTISASDKQQVELGKSTINFQENSFIDKNGNVYKGEVELAYTEYFDPLEIMLSGITMASDSSNENLMFSSVGMFDLTAQDVNGNPLELAEDKPASVSMFSTNNRTDMNLYSLNKEGNWEYEGKDEVIEPFKVDVKGLDSVFNKDIIAMRNERIVVAGNRFVPRIKRNGSQKSFDIRFDELFSMNYENASRINDILYVYRNDEVAELVARTTFVYDGDMDSLSYYHKALKYMRKVSRKSYKRLSSRIVKGQRKYGVGVNYVQSLDVYMDPEKDNLRLTFSFKDSLVSIPVVLKSNANNPRSRMSVFKKFFKKYDRQKVKRNKVWRNRNRKLTKRIKAFEDYLRANFKQLELMRQAENYNAARINKMKNNGSVKREFEIPRLGVWNCDARSRMKNPFVIARNFISKGTSKINEAVDRIMVIDFDNNGVIQFKDKEESFFDRASNSAILVFFAGGIVGVYNHIKNRKIVEGDALELELIDFGNIGRDEFKERIQD